MASFSWNKTVGMKFFCSVMITQSGVFCSDWILLIWNSWNLLSCNLCCGDSDYAPETGSCEFYKEL